MQYDFFQLVTPFAISIGLGALVGLERERGEVKIAGFRTFVLIAAFGTLTALLSESIGMWIIPAGLISVVVYLVSGRFNPREKLANVGRTTEVASLLTFANGVLVWFGPKELAIALGIGMTALLYFKPELHGVAREIERNEYIAILQFALIAFVILPILPNQGFGPWEVFNPYRIWLIVVLVAGINLAGYIALKFFGSRFGAPLAGLLGGLVSSTATSISFAQLAGKWMKSSHMIMCAITTANTTVYARIAIALTIINPAVAQKLYIPLGVIFCMGAILALVSWQAAKKDNLKNIPKVKNPASLATALQFGLLFAVVLFLVAASRNIFNFGGLTLVTIASSFTDVDAINLSLAELAHSGQLLVERAAFLILLATLVNLIFKLGLILYFSKGTLKKLAITNFAIIGVVTVIAMQLIN
jgi:uncharacterized membrane protein (DUF4010 family)